MDLTKLSDAELIDLAHQQLATQPASQQVASDAITRGAQNFAQDMPWYQKAAAGYGSAAPVAGSGIEQLLGLKSQQQIDEQKRLLAPLLRTGAGAAGNILGNAALYAPTMYLPGSSSIIGSGVIGAGIGATQPVATGESRLANTALMSGGSMLGTAVGKGIGRLARPVQSTLTPGQQRLAGVAADEGIPLTLGQRTGSRPMQLTESVLENMPLTSAKQLGIKQAQQDAFVQAALRKAGTTGTEATPEVLGQQFGKLGGTFEDIAGRNVLDFNKTDITSKLANIASDATQKLPPEQAAKVAGTVDRIIGQVGPDGTMLGTNYQGWREPLRRLAKGADAEGYFYGRIRSAMDKAFNAGLSGEDAARWAEASGQYGNLKTITQAMGGAGARARAGMLSPAQLESALTSQVGRQGKALGRGGLNDLVGAGRNFVSETLPDSFTSQRQFYTKLLTGGALPGAGLGAAAGYGYTGTPQGALAGAGIGAGAGTGAAFLLPSVVQAAMLNPLLSSYLERGLPYVGGLISPTRAAALSQTGRLAGTAAIPALLGAGG